MQRSSLVLKREAKGLIEEGRGEVCVSNVRRSSSIYGQGGARRIARSTSGTH
jgi:hypothetical protein